MEKHKCKICSRTFNNGRALGGHMKAHLATLKRLPPPKPQHPFTTTQSPSFSSSFSQSESEQQHKPLFYADPDFSSLAPDRESETESSKNPTRQQRSKRNRKSSYKHFTAPPSPPPMETEQPLRSVSNTSPEEDVAMCLMMLSRDKWNKKNNNINVIESTPLKIRVIRGKHVCENCRKTFRSSKALTSHTSVCYPRLHENEENNNNKIFECPFCLKVFGSGQALGGHKTSNLIIQSSSSTSRMLNFKESFIDLNLPAPLEDDDDILSVVSDA